MDCFTFSQILTLATLYKPGFYRFYYTGALKLVSCCSLLVAGNQCYWELIERAFNGNLLTTGHTF